MSLTLFPDDQSRWSLKVAEPTETVYSESAEEGSELVNNGTTLIATVSDMPVNQVVDLYATVSEGFCITADKQFVVNFKCSLLPSFFDEAIIYVQDASGNEIHYTYSLDDMGHDYIINIKSKADNPDFNPAFVKVIGFRFTNPSETGKTLIVSLDYLLVSDNRLPTYCTAQDVVSFMGMLNNEGKPFVLTHCSYPSIETINDLIIQAEAYIDGNTKTSWRENRVVKQIYNAPAITDRYLASPLQVSLYYMGNAAWQDFIKGLPIPLYHTWIRDIDYSKGDLIETRWIGSAWNVMPECHSLQPGVSPYWCDNEKGILFLKTFLLGKLDSIRITYRWGQTEVPDDIRTAAIIYTAKQVLCTDWYRAKFPMSPEFDPAKMQTIALWDEQLQRCLMNHQTLVLTGSI